MKVLAINCGSSSLKFKLFAAEGRQAHKLAGGLIDRIGSQATLNFSAPSGPALKQAESVADHGQGMKLVLDWLHACGLTQPDGLGAVAHRVVHGADRFVEPTLIDDAVIGAIQALSDLAPLHNLPSLDAIRGARAVLGALVPMVAVFDTAFHRTMPPHASNYALPADLADRNHIRKYGFHGSAHRFMLERYLEITRTTAAQTRLITLQLGNGCSAAAIASGRSVDTSMGFTPLEGLVMGTRSGDIDPSVVSYLARKEKSNADEVEDWLNRRSGLLGVSGASRDMRELLAREQQGDRRAALAVEMFCYRARKYIGSYLAVLGGADAVIFGGGIGEHAPTVRARICAGMEWCGLVLDPARNDALTGAEGLISADEARTHAFVLPVDEEVILVRDTLACLARR
jgi:acetate kinase